MEYVQMTINDWLELKNKLKLELQGVKQSFVRIGYVLRKIDDQKLYEQDGYKSIAEFAKAEYGLEASTVSRFMSINREYSVDGYSEHLKEEYLDMGRSQLEEMLKLPEVDREMIQPEASREDIRELKRFNKAEPAAGVADDIRQLIEMFFRDNKEITNAIYKEDADFTGSLDRRIELVNPGGNRSFKKGLFFMMMYEDNIKIKKFSSDPLTMSWTEFFDIAKEKFKDIAAVISENVSKLEPEDERKEPEKSTHEPERNTAEKEDKKAIAPAQKSLENKGKSEEIQPENEVKEVEVIKEIEEAINPPEIVDKPYGSRKEYIDSLSIEEAAMYIADEYKRHNLKASSLAFPTELEEWLSQEVDVNGHSVI